MEDGKRGSEKGLRTLIFGVWPLDFGLSWGKIEDQSPKSKDQRHVSVPEHSLPDRLFA
jgi:hypothetical protein